MSKIYISPSTIKKMTANDADKEIVMRLASKFNPNRGKEHLPNRPPLPPAKQKQDRYDKKRAKSIFRKQQRIQQEAEKLKRVRRILSIWEKILIIFAVTTPMPSTARR